MSKIYLIIEMMILIALLKGSAENVGDAYEDVLSHHLVSANQLQHTSSSYIHAAIIITTVQAKPQDLLPGAESGKSKLFSGPCCQVS